MTWFFLIMVWRWAVMRFVFSFRIYSDGNMIAESYAVKSWKSHGFIRKCTWWTKSRTCNFSSSTHLDESDSGPEKLNCWRVRLSVYISLSQLKKITTLHFVIILYGNPRGVLVKNIGQEVVWSMRCVSDFLEDTEAGIGVYKMELIWGLKVKNDRVQYAYRFRD